MVFKIGLSISGDSFFLESVVSKIVGDFIVKSSNSPGDKFERRNGNYDFGSVLFWYTKNFSTEEYIEKYEKYFVDFLEDNYLIFTKNGADNFSFFIEIYYDGGQCNFEIFNKTLLKKIKKLNVSITVSVYTLSKDKLQEWANEIELDWAKC